MTLVSSVTTTSNCRRAKMPACEATDTSSNANAIALVADALLYVKQGDIIDVGIDWSAWMAANEGRIASSAWAAHAASPAAPTLISAATDFSAERHESFTLVDASAAAVGDIYYLSNTITVADATACGDADIPTRTMTRNIYVKVVY